VLHAVPQHGHENTSVGAVCWWILNGSSAVGGPAWVCCSCVGSVGAECWWILNGSSAVGGPA